VKQPEFVIANKVKIHREEALDLVRQCREVRVAKGKKWLHFPGQGDEEVICKAILGRSGTLRAPAMKVDDVFVVGFHPEGYAEVFGE